LFPWRPKGVTVRWHGVRDATPPPRRGALCPL